MSVYKYEDTYVVRSIEDVELTQAETDAITDVTKQGVEDPFYLEKMVVCLVYITLAGRQLEAEGMDAKTTHYTREYKRYQQMNNFNGTDEGAFSGTVERG